MAAVSVKRSIPKAPDLQTYSLTTPLLPSQKAVATKSWYHFEKSQWKRGVQQRYVNFQEKLLSKKQIQKKI